MRAEYEGMAVDALAERLALAEDVCRMYGWSGSAEDSDRDKALTELWMQWRTLAGDAVSDPKRYPHLNDEAQFALATQRDLTRHTTLRGFFGDDYGSPPS